jgi:hypothetical protein
MSKKPEPPPRHLRPECGHPNDWTLDLMRLDGVIESYCMGCIVKKLGMKPVDMHIIKDNKLVKIERRQLR